jgi:ribosomal-protein-alanine N-acetyltransferase
MIHFPILETARLLLRQLRAGDAEAICKVLGENLSRRMNEIEAVGNLPQATRLIEEINAKLIAEKGIYWAVVDKQINRIIGICGGDWYHRIACAELHFDFSPELENAELMTEALRRVMQYAFEEIRLNRVEVMIRSDDQAAIKWLTESGFQMEGVLRSWRPINGEFQDHACYSMLREEYLP